ncbi:MAG: histidine phosphatase family protein [Candidatus Nanopelagicales bacterium]
MRHGEAHVNMSRNDGLVHVDDELGLTERGVEQAQRLRDRIAKDSEIRPDVIISSTFRRASQTASIASEHLTVPITSNDEIQEWRIGPDAADVTLETALASWQRICAGTGHDDRLSPLTESHNEFISRVDAELLRIADAHAGQDVLVFTHGGVVGRSFQTFLGLSQAAPLVGIHPKHAALTEWHLAEEFGTLTWVLGRYNDATHLHP